MNDLKILILLLYYERPILLRNALNSIMRANKLYDNWHLAFIDDSSPTPGSVIVDQYMRRYLPKISFYHTNTTIEEKIEHGSIIGQCMNQAIMDSDADIAFMLCDDDELVPKYLLDLNTFFNVHKSVQSCYSHVYVYNPAFEISDYVNRVECKYNKFTACINPSGKVDASQVAWKTSVNKKSDIWFQYPRTRNLDSDFYKKLVSVCGRIPFSHFFSQYKSWSRHRLEYINEKDIWQGYSVDAPELEKQTTVEDLIFIINSYANRKMFDEANRILTRAKSLHPDNLLLKTVLEDRYVTPIKQPPYRTPKAVSEAIKDIISNKVVCDIGCAEGDHMVFMSRYAKKVIGVEIDQTRYKFAIERNLDVIVEDYRKIDLPDADVYYIWPNNSIDNPFIIKKALNKTNFNGYVIIGADSGYEPEVPMIKKCAKLGRLLEIPFNEGSGHRQNGIFFVVIIDIIEARKMRDQCVNVF